MNKLIYHKVEDSLPKCDKSYFNGSYRSEVFDVVIGIVDGAFIHTCAYLKYDNGLFWVEEHSNIPIYPLYWIECIPNEITHNNKPKELKFPMDFSTSENKQQWYSVTDKLPEVGIASVYSSELVLILCNGKYCDIPIGTYIATPQPFWLDVLGDVVSVTHWMPLPPQTN